MVPVGRSRATPFLTGGAARLKGAPSSVGARAHHQIPDHNLEMDAGLEGCGWPESTDLTFSQPLLLPSASKTFPFPEVGPPHGPDQGSLPGGSYCIYSATPGRSNCPRPLWVTPPTLSLTIIGPTFTSGPRSWAGKLWAPGPPARVLIIRKGPPTSRSDGMRAIGMASTRPRRGHPLSPLSWDLGRVSRTGWAQCRSGTQCSP